MKFLIVYGLAVVSSVLAQNTSMPAKECLSKCDQSNALWVTCAAECVGVPHPTNKDVQKTKDCFNQCDKNDGDCQNHCIKTHFVSSNTDGPGSATATPTGMAGSATYISGRTGSVMATGASNVATSTGVNRSPSVTPLNGSTRNDATIMAVGALISGLIWSRQ